MLYPYPLAVGAINSDLVRYNPRTWAEFQHPEYRRNVEQWTYARDHYTGDLLLADRVARYLIQKYLGETPEAYAERVALADYTPHFGAVVDSLVGMLFQSEADASKQWGALGGLDDLSTPLGKLRSDADGAGHGYETLWRLLAIELTGIHRAWVLVDGNVAGAPRVRVLPAEAVPNWRYENGTLVEAMVCEHVDTRTSLEDSPDQEKQYVRFTTTGWQRYRVVEEKGNATSVAIGDPGKYKYEDPKRQLTLPLFPVDLPLQRPVGYLLSRKANAIFNQESTRDAGLRQACFAILNVVGNDAVFKKVTEMLKAGARALPNLPNVGTHGFIAPSGDPARVLTDVLKIKTEDFWRTGFREYSDAASRKTAEEVRQDVASGVGAFLSLLKAAVDDAENQALWRLEQTMFPDERGKWFEARVQRSDDFVPFDINQTIERLRKRYFGEAAVVPVGRDARIEAARQIAEWDGLPINDGQIEASVDGAAIERTLELTRDLPLPAQAKADMTVRFLMALGYMDAEDTVPAADGSSQPAVEVIRQRALAIAQALETDALRASAAMSQSAPDQIGGVSAA